MREYPSYAIVAVGAVVALNNSIILVKRGYPPAQGRWSLPGGVVEAGERILDAAKRELYEETGITAEPLGVVYIVNDVVRDLEGGIRYHYLILDVLFDPGSVRGKLRPGGDAMDVAWISLEEALNRDDVSRTTKKLISRLIKNGFHLLQVEEMEFLSK